ncbi:MAG: MMPL family transporter [Planctomycetaceae bacterium]
MPNISPRRNAPGSTPALGIIALMVFLLPLCWWSLKQMRLDGGGERWLSDQHPQIQMLEQAHRLFPAEDRIFLSWDGSSLGDPRVGQLARRFEGIIDQFGVKREGLKEIAHVVQPRDALLLMQQEGVEPQEAARRLQGVSLGAGPLKIRLTEAGRIRLRKTRLELQAAVTNSAAKPAQALPPMENLEIAAAIPRPAEEGASALPDPAPPAVMDASGRLISRDILAHDLQLLWDGIAPGSDQTEEIVAVLKAVTGPDGAPLVEDCFFVLGSPVALVVGLSDVGRDDRSQTLQLIRQTAVEVGIAPESLHLGGSIIANARLDQAVREAIWNPSAHGIEIQKHSLLLLSALVGAGLVLVMVRSFRLALLIVAASLFATFLSMSMIPALDGGQNPLFAVMPTLLFVSSLAGSMRLINYGKSAVVDKPRATFADAVRSAMVPCLLAGVTITIGLAALCTSSLAPVRDFGLFAAIGAMVSLAVILYGLPSLLQMWFPSALVSAESDRRGWREYGRTLSVRPSFQALLILTFAFVCSWGLRNFRTEARVIGLFPESAEIVRDQRTLENELAGLAPVEILVRFDKSAQDEINFLDRLEILRKVEENLRAHPEITGCLALPDFQPVTEQLAEDSGMLAQGRYKKRSIQVEQRIRDQEVSGMDAFYRQLPDSEAGLDSQDSQTFGRPGEELWRITAQARLMSDSDHGKLVSDIDDLTQEILRFRPGTQHIVTGDATLLLQTQQALQQGLIRSLGWTFALLLGVCAILLRSFWAGLAAMIPSVMPIAVVFGLLGWFEQRIDLGVMITASIALAMSADGSLHFLGWFRQGLRDGLDRPAAIGFALTRCGPVLCQMNLIMALGLLMLMPADLVLISRFGWVMASMIGVALIGNLVLLPQLLASPVGHLFSLPTPSRPAQRPPSDAAETLPGPPHLSTVSMARGIRVPPE